MTPEQIKANDDFYVARNAAHIKRIVDHLVLIAGIDKVYAWNAAKRYAEMGKLCDESTGREYAEIPALLTQEMRLRNEIRSQDRREQKGNS